MTLSAGTRLGPYEILSPLGAGGMGEVYRARDTKLGRDVAIKVLPGRLAADAESLSRFEREARAVAALSHPNILAIHDFGTDGGVTYAVMELLEGETLRAALSGGALPVRKATDVAREIARGLAAAHERGIVHRDLKPENIFVTRDGRVKILDFGLAKSVSAGAAPAETRSPRVSSYTEPGTVLGTVDYMSPEQVRGEPLDPRSDIFSFGAVLYEMLSGRRAFEKGTVAETMAAILREEPPEIGGSGRAIPPGLYRVLRHCLEKNPESRFQSSSDAAFALESLTASSGAAEVSGGPGPPARWRSRMTERLVFAAVGALIAASIAVPVVTQSQRSRLPPPLPRMRFTIAPPRDASFAGMLALSPDGKNLAFVAAQADGRDVLYVRPLDSLDARPLEGTDGAAYPFWSPDGHALAFFAQGKLKRIEAAGGSLLVLCDAANPRGGSWGSRGTIVFSIAIGGEIQRVSENGGQAAAVPPLTAQKGNTYRWPSFLPDGRHFLYYFLGQDPDSSGIHVASLDAKQTTRLVFAETGAVYVAPGFLLYRSGDRLMGQRFDLDRLRLTGEAFSVVDHVWWDAAATGGMAASASGTGVLACETGGAAVSRLLWYDRSGRELDTIRPDGAYWEPTLSPDDRWLAIPRMDPEKVASSLWTIDLERGSLARVSSQALVATPLWSSDGRRIVYSSYLSGEVFVRDARGAESEKLLFKNESFTPLDDWSRDGRFLFYDTLDWKTFHSDVWMRDLQTGTSRAVLQAQFDQAGARLSPDGRWLAYESDESGTFEVSVRSFPELGERRQISVGGGRQPRWRGDGKELFFVSPDRKIMAVEIRPGSPFEAGAPRALFQTRILPQVEARNHYDVTADGQRFLVNSRRPEDAALPITVLAPWSPGAHP